MIRLLIKTHNVTGLKYLCKTEQKNWEKYSGSGIYWKSHLKKHGTNFSTILLFETDDKCLFKQIALEYSVKYNIVSSEEWANFCPETGDGGPTMTGKKRPDAVANSRQMGLKNKGRKLPQVSISNKSRKGIPQPLVSKRMVGNSYVKGKKLPAVGEHNKRFSNTKWYNNGIINKRSSQQPTGFECGKIKKRKDIIEVIL